MRKIGYLTTVITIIVVFELPAFAQQEQNKEINYWKKLCFFQDKEMGGFNVKGHKFLHSLSQEKRLKLLMQFSESEKCKKIPIGGWYKTPFFIFSIMDGFVAPNVTKDEFHKLNKKEQGKLMELEEANKKRMPEKDFNKIFNALTDKKNKKYAFFRFAMLVMLREVYKTSLTPEQEKRVANLALKLYNDKTECEPVRNESLCIVSDDLYGKLEKSIKSIVLSDATAKKAIKKEGLQIVLEKIKKNEFKLNPETIKKLQPFLKQGKEFYDYLEQVKKNEKTSAVYKHTIDCALSQMQLLPLNLLENGSGSID